jgi:hypothetical protein
MSDPPLAPTSFSRKNKSRNGGTNVSKKLLMEFQALIAYACRAMFTNDDDRKGTSELSRTILSVLVQLIRAASLTGTSDTNKSSEQGDIALLPSTSTSPSLSQQQGKTGNAAGVKISPPPNYFFKGFLA